MRKSYGRHRRNVIRRRFQVAWMIIAFIITVVVVIFAASKLLGKKESDGLNNQNSNIVDNNNGITPTGGVENGGEDNKPDITPEGEKNNITITPEPTITPLPEVTPDSGDNGTPVITNIPGKEDSTSNGSSGEEVSTEKMIALTFDDGPYPPVTNRILDILEANGAHATFFVMGNRMNEYGDTAERAYSLGNQIGNHTFSHKDLTKLNAESIRYEVEHSNDCIAAYAPVGNAVLRPPYGAKNDTVYSTVKVPMIAWNVDPEDWKSRDKDSVIKNIIDIVQDGDIVLMHDLYSSTADAMEVVIPKLIEMGYKLVTVDELFEAKGITLEPGVMYRHAEIKK